MSAGADAPQGATLRFDALNRFTGAVQFTAEIDCAENAPISVKRGLAVKWAVKNGANLADANLAGAHLAGAYLAGANLAGADLAGANLADADLAGAHLAGAYLAGANLAGAHLAGAYLAGAHLAGADLAGAHLAGADLAGAYLAGANVVIDGGTPNGYRVVAYHYDGGIMLRAGCKTFSADEAAEYWRARPERAECLAALAYIKTVADLRGWGRP